MISPATMARPTATVANTADKERYTKQKESLLEMTEDRASNIALLERPNDHQSLPNREMQIPKQHKGYLLLKRCFDFVSSLCVGVVLLVPMGILALMIMIKDPGNPFYVQQRVGQNGRKIGVLKFRSMRKGADHLENMLTPEQIEQYKREYKLNDDPRLIGYKNPGDGNRCFGAFIRRTSLDELPQIVWNICIKGDMSVVGPRPILIDELIENYSEEERELFLSVKPGLTGYWQAYARNNATYETGKRQQMELYYVKNQSARLDLKILFATIGAVLEKQGAK